MLSYLFYTLFSLYLIPPSLKHFLISHNQNNMKFLTSQYMVCSGVILLFQSHVLKNCHFIHMKWNKLSQQSLWTLLKNTVIHSTSFIFFFYLLFWVKNRITSLRRSGVNYFYVVTLLSGWLEAALLEIHFDLLQWMRGKVKELLHN